MMTFCEPTVMIDELTGIWQRLFGRSTIRPTDNFFDLGGDPALGVRLFAEIARSTGRELPPMTIFHAPTIAALAFGPFYKKARALYWAFAHSKTGDRAKSAL